MANGIASFYGVWSWISQNIVWKQQNSIAISHETFLYKVSVHSNLFQIDNTKQDKDVRLATLQSFSTTFFLKDPLRLSIW